MGRTAGVPFDRPSVLGKPHRPHHLRKTFYTHLSLFPGTPPEDGAGAGGRWGRGRKKWLSAFSAVLFLPRSIYAWD